MIFLGAGASKIFGTKTMQDLTQDLVKRMSDRGHKKVIDEILQALKKFGLTPDFENIYTTLEALANPTEGIKRSGAFTAFLASRRGFQDFEKHPEYFEVLSDFRNLIYSECTILRGKIEENGSVFERLFQVFGQRSESRFLPSKTRRSPGSSREAIVHPSYTIVTTNYDVSVELYHRWKNLTLADGFRATEGYTRELDLSEYGRLHSSRWLIKLHGSIWQFKQGDKIIQTTQSPESLPIKISVGEQMMIYPVGEKPILREPYYSFYSIFKAQPWKTLVTIGYSFRDEPVNVAILDNLEYTPQSKLIVVTLDPKETIQNLGILPKSKFDDRVIPVKGSFGDEHVFKKLKLAVRVGGKERFLLRGREAGLLQRSEVKELM